MKIDKPKRPEIVAVTLTPNEKSAIVQKANEENRTISGFIRDRLRDVFDGACHCGDISPKEREEQ